MRSKNLLISWLKKLFSDLHSAVIAIIVVGLFAGGVGIHIFAKNLWNVLIDIMQSPAPLWGTIALVLVLGIYVYLKTTIGYLSSPQPIKDFFVITGEYKWKVFYIAGNSYGVESVPYCKKHDLRLIDSGERNPSLICPDIENSPCNIDPTNEELNAMHSIAISLAEQKLRKKGLLLGSI